MKDTSNITINNFRTLFKTNFIIYKIWFIANISKRDVYFRINQILLDGLKQQNRIGTCDSLKKDYDYGKCYFG